MRVNGFLDRGSTNYAYSSIYGGLKTTHRLWCVKPSFSEHNEETANGGRGWIRTSGPLVRVGRLAIDWIKPTLPRAHEKIGE